MPTAANIAPQAHYRAELKAISRTNKAGERRRSIISAVAYGSRSTLPDLRQDREWSYTRKRDLAHSEILVPAIAPAWATDRAELWNRVDAAERRKDANTGRELVLSLPRQLDRAAQIAALRDFAERELLSRGLAVDVNLHKPKALDGQPNDHAHLFFPTRAFDSDGFAKKKLPWLSNPTDAAGEMEALRGAWAACLNRQLELTGRNARVSHLSNSAQAELADAVAADVARPLSERAAAARALDDLTRPPEPKIGHVRVAQARREVRSARRREGHKIELADQLAATSRVAAEVIDLRAARAARRVETAKALNWTPADDARRERAAAAAVAKSEREAAGRARRRAKYAAARVAAPARPAPTPAAPAPARPAAPVPPPVPARPAPARSPEWSAQVNAATTRLRSNPREREAARQRLGIEVVPGDVRDQWAVAQSRAEIEGFQSRFFERGWPRPSGLVVPPDTPKTSLLIACLRALTWGARQIMTLVRPDARKTEDGRFRRFAAEVFPTAKVGAGDWARHPPKPEPPPVVQAPEPELDLPDDAADRRDDDFRPT